MPSRTVPSTIASADASSNAPRALAPRAAGAVDRPVAGEEHGAAGEDAAEDGAVPRPFPDRLIDEVEGNGADQDAGAEPHDQADRAQPDPKPKRDSCAEHE
jgi:hypothetical protein